MIHDIEPFDEFTGPSEPIPETAPDHCDVPFPYAMLMALAALSKARAIRRRMSETDINDCGDGFFPDGDGRAA